MPQHKHVLVIGGGVVGTACAYYLLRAGWSVTMLERDRFGMACSHGNCGFISPSHVLPLAEPGAVSQAIRALTSRNAPFKIKPRLDFSLMIWLIRFALRCNTRDMLEAGKGIQALLDSSRALYDELLSTESIECEFEARGMLMPYRDRRALEHYRHTDRLLREHFNRPATRYNADELLEIEPALAPGLAGAWCYPGDAHLRPDKLLSSWRKVLETQGVAIHEGTEVTGFKMHAAKATAALTPHGEHPADAFVLAAGALTPKLALWLGCSIPIQPGKGYSLLMPRPHLCPRLPLLFHETRVAVTPMQTAFRLGSTMEFAGYDDSLPPERLQLLLDGAAPYLREPLQGPVESPWFGWRPMTFDGLPIIDRSPAMSNVLIAAGHNMFGLSMAPATGKLAAEMLSDLSPHINTRPYRVRRF
jgi:D-amino-acid dehydrogenase